MPSRILLISTNKCDFPYPVFPLGLAMIDEAARRAGHTTRLLDRQFDETPIKDVIRDFRPDFVGMSLRNIDEVVFRHHETHFGPLVDLCHEIHQHLDCPLILGGSGFSIFPDQLMELSGADFGILGEGEKALTQLLAALETGQDCRGIPGLFFRSHNRVVSNPGMSPRARLDSDPSSRPPGLAEYYLRESSMLNLQTQRGCPFECCYCTYPLLEGRSHRRRPPEMVAEEMLLLQRHGARYGFIVDSVFNSSLSHVVETCEAIIRRGVKMRWCCSLRPQGLTREQMHLMARAGLTHVEFGSDSFCDPVLQAYGKRFTFDDILSSSELAHAEKIDYCHFLICGGPGETRDTLRQTYENSKRLPNATILALTGMRVYPGTPLFGHARAHGTCPDAIGLLEPHFFFSPGLDPDDVTADLAAFSAQSPNWIVNEPQPQYYAMASRLRQRGVVGPLWSYLSLMQRVLPRPI
ncbi:MAG TPA: lipid biosynthesis B12-binding/radical SAM protein [Verrucomicrobiae bacterium]|nr:lipid biosynthesis B12-binding/radical SAM protein [Verrucomicrobiae bacterium]